MTAEQPARQTAANVPSLHVNWETHTATVSHRGREFPFGMKRAIPAETILHQAVTHHGEEVTSEEIITRTGLTVDALGRATSTLVGRLNQHRDEDTDAERVFRAFRKKFKLVGITIPEAIPVNVTGEFTSRLDIPTPEPTLRPVMTPNEQRLLLFKQNKRPTVRREVREGVSVVLKNMPDLFVLRGSDFAVVFIEDGEFTSTVTYRGDTNLAAFDYFMGHPYGIRAGEIAENAVPGEHIASIDGLLSKQKSKLEADMPPGTLVQTKRRGALSEHTLDGRVTFIEPLDLEPGELPFMILNDPTAARSIIWVTGTNTILQMERVMGDVLRSIPDSEEQARTDEELIALVWDGKDPAENRRKLLWHNLRQVRKAISGLDIEIKKKTVETPDGKKTAYYLERTHSLPVDDPAVFEGDISFKTKYGWKVTNPFHRPAPGEGLLTDMPPQDGYDMDALAGAIPLTREMPITEIDPVFTTRIISHTPYAEIGAFPILPLSGVVPLTKELPVATPMQKKPEPEPDQKVQETTERPLTNELAIIAGALLGNSVLIARYKSSPLSEFVPEEKDLRDVIAGSSLADTRIDQAFINENVVTALDIAQAFVREHEISEILRGMDKDDPMKPMLWFVAWLCTYPVKFRGNDTTALAVTRQFFIDHGAKEA